VTWSAFSQAITQEFRRADEDTLKKRRIIKARRGPAGMPASAAAAPDEAGAHKDGSTPAASANPFSGISLMAPVAGNPFAGVSLVAPSAKATEQPAENKTAEQPAEKVNAAFETMTLYMHLLCCLFEL
jgi:hypothetical protein